MRHFPCWLTAFNEYAQDGFVPSRFYEWVGRSVLAASVERKVTLKQGRIHHVPNIYVMLVAHPAVGKSTAIEAGVSLFEAVKKKHNPALKIIPNQATEPALVDLMKIRELIKVGPTSFEYPHSSAFFYASEASASALQNTCGDFVATMTAFYDCPPWFRKKTKGEKDAVEIENSCMNLLSGATFNYLKTLVNEQSVLGGFASRLIYVVETERKIRQTKWHGSQEFDSAVGRKLVEDLAVISKLFGPMVPTEGFMALFEEWRPKFDLYLKELNSERLEAIMSRKGTHLLKLSMILSLSEGDSLVVTERHFERALEIIEDVYKDNAQVIVMAAIADRQSQSGVNQVILQSLKRGGGRMKLASLKGAVIAFGHSVDNLTKTMDYMMSANLLKYNASSGEVELMVEPNSHL